MQLILIGNKTMNIILVYKAGSKIPFLNIIGKFDDIDHDDNSLHIIYDYGTIIIPEDAWDCATEYSINEENVRNYESFIRELKDN